LFFVLTFIIINLTSLKKEYPIIPQGGTMVCFGDSLTAGYGAREGNSYPDFLQKRVNLKIINSGVSGDTTVDARKRFEEDVLEHNPDIVVIELGANDGITQANTAHFEKYKGWNGLLIEPIPSKFLECVRNRSDKNHFVCGACVGFDYKEQFVELIYSDLMTISKELSGRDDAEAHAQKGLNVMKSHETNFTFGAKAYTLTSLLKEAKAPQTVDLLSLDVEGAELEVLKGLDFEAYTFKYMLIECWDKDGITAFLEEKGYKIVKQLSRHDYLFSK